jgi:sulfur carrier protein ThiS
MKVRVKLFGILQKDYPNYDPLQGVEIEVSDDATVKDLLSKMGSPKIHIGVVSMRGQILKQDSQLEDGAEIHILQPLYGG